jgi:hypothetical protein
MNPFCRGKSRLLVAEHRFDVTRSVEDAKHVDAVCERAIENQMLVESRDSPRAQVSQLVGMELSRRAHEWHLGKTREREFSLVQESEGEVKPSFLRQVLRVCEQVELGVVTPMNPALTHEPRLPWRFTNSARNRFQSAAVISLLGD